MSNWMTTKNDVGFYFNPDSERTDVIIELPATKVEAARDGKVFVELDIKDLKEFMIPLISEEIIWQIRKIDWKDVLL